MARKMSEPGTHRNEPKSNSILQTFVPSTRILHHSHSSLAILQPCLSIQLCATSRFYSLHTGLPVNQAHVTGQRAASGSAVAATTILPEQQTGRNHGALPIQWSEHTMRFGGVGATMN
jgi:hypothetical protein